MLTAHRSWGLALALGLLACATPTGSRKSPTETTAPSAAFAQLDSYTLARIPDWSDRYATADPATDVRYFRIPKLMKDFGLSRFEAVELQNHYRDFTTRGVAGPEAFTHAVQEVKAGRLGSGVDLAKLRSAPFIVVYDLDETLYQAFYASGKRGPAWRDLSFDSRGETAYIKLRPGWEQALRRVRELGGLVMIFTARSDDIAESAVSQWRLGDQNIREVIDGFLTKSHLVQQDKADGDPVVFPSKDLRMFDESLERVIIVDDNPRRVVQHHRQRLIKKFQADPYLAVKNGPEGRSVLTASFEATLPMVVRELEESVAFQRAHPGTSFATAYLPYTMLGQTAVEALVTTGLTTEQARDYIRKNPGYVDEAF